MKVGIIGFSKTTRDGIPWTDPSWQLWGVNDTWTFEQRPLDAIFEVHSPEIYEWPLRRHPGHLAHLKASDWPVFLIGQRSDIPKSLAYPLADVVDDIGRPYLTSSIAYAIAFAIHLHMDTIGLWGIDLVTAHEYAGQRPCVEWLLGLAQARGIEVVLPEGCKLLAGPLYGRGDANPGGEKLTHGQFEERLAVLTEREREIIARLDRCRHDLGMLDGARKESAFWLERLGGNAAMLAPLQARADRLALKEAPLQAEIQGLVDILVKVQGMKSECQFWVSQTPEGGQPERVLGYPTHDAEIAMPALRAVQ